MKLVDFLEHFSTFESFDKDPQNFKYDRYVKKMYNFKEFNFAFIFFV